MANIVEIRDMSDEEIEEMLENAREEYFNLRFQHGIGQLENPTKMKQTKKDIARLNTVLNQMVRNPQDTDN